MNQMDLNDLGAVELARLIGLGEVSALEAAEQHIARIEEVNPRLNAVVARRYDQARAEARAVDARRARGEALGPLAGVPVTIKESIDVAGMPSTYGLKWRAALAADSDEPHVARLRQAGAVILGKTNVAQLLAYIESDNPVYGRSLNPWNVERTCGGSSGGEAAIIAAAGSPLGLGTDIGGSVRYPAAFCGIVGIKPTAGRCDDSGRWSFPLGQRAIRSQVGVLARGVADAALGLAAIEGHRETGALPVPALADWRRVDVSGMRVGYYLDDGSFASAPAVRRAVREAADALAAAGARVAEWRPPDPAHALGVAFGLLGADGGAWFDQALRGTPAHPTVKLMRLLAARSPATLKSFAALLRTAGQSSLADGLLLFSRKGATEYWQLVEQQRECRRIHADAMDRAESGPLDVILGPASALPALRHGTTKDLGLAGANTIQYNLLGYPAGVVPVTRVRRGEESDRPASRDVVMEVARKCEAGSAGLPIGVQLAARPWHDHLALAAMFVVEQAARRQADFPAKPPL